MDREQIAFALMAPADYALGSVVAGLKATGNLDRATDPFYESVRSVLPGLRP